MARAAAAADVYTAIAEPRRREIIDTLARHGARPVGELVQALGLPQPSVSKHLGVLREAGIVTMSKRGRQRVYALNPAELKTVHDWTSAFERFWSHQLDRIKQAAERKARESRTTNPPFTP